MRHSSLICLILTLTSAPLSAQAPGAGAVRIRLVPANADWKPMIGTAVSMGLDTIQLVLDGKKDTIKVLRTELDRVERSTSRKSNSSRGLLFGLLIGGTAGGAAGYLLRSSGLEGGEIEPWVLPAGIGAGALLGGVIGGVWGAKSHRERWEAMPTMTSERVTHSGGARSAVRIGLAGRIAF